MPPRIPTGRSGRGGHDELFDSAKAEVRASELMIGFLFNYYYYLFFFDLGVGGCEGHGKKKESERARCWNTCCVYFEIDNSPRALSM